MSTKFSLLALSFVLLCLAQTHAQQDPACEYPQVNILSDADPIYPSWTPIAPCANDKTLWDPSVLWDDYAQLYRLFFTRWNGCTQHMHIYTTESTDGLIWDGELHDIHDPTKEPSWGQGIMNNFETTSAIQINDSTFYVYFLGYTHANRVDRIGLIISTDYGQTYTPYYKNPVLKPTQSWETSAVGVKEPSVIYDSTDSLFKMWYNVTTYTKITRVGYATSPDGKNWTKYPDNPVFLPLTEKIGEEWPGEVNHVNVVQDPVYGYHLFYANHFAIFQAYSTDGIDWTREPGYYPQVMYEYDSAYQPCEGCPWIFDSLDAYGSPSMIFKDNGEAFLFLMRTIPGAYGYGKNPPGVTGPGGMMLGLATGICFTPVSVNPSEEKTIGIQIFPNPAAKHVTINIQNSFATSADMILRDIFGRTILSVTQFTLPHFLNIEELQSGVYFIELRTDHPGYFKGKLIVE
ncbi:MAG: T9SS type A sorting domain-containing protein [Bacteroidales bacterium]|nr:T9SS type A sorting domain-containing protein [Bacteroidales bacterium]